MSCPHLQMSQHQHKHMGKVGPQATPPSSVMWNPLLSGQIPAPAQAQAPPIDLRTQVQPFQDLQPDEIQDQLQKLHIQHPDAMMMGASDFDPSSPTSSFSSQPVDNGQNFVESNSSATSSRKSSSGNSLIVQLLSPSPPAVPIASPQTEGMSSATPHGTPSGSMGSRKSSLPPTSSIQRHSRPHRYDPDT